MPEGRNLSRTQNEKIVLGSVSVVVLKELLPFLNSFLTEKQIRALFCLSYLQYGDEKNFRDFGLEKYVMTPSPKIVAKGFGFTVKELDSELSVAYKFFNSLSRDVYAAIDG